jgi:hypothetical protein
MKVSDEIEIGSPNDHSTQILTDQSVLRNQVDALTEKLKQAEAELEKHKTYDLTAAVLAKDMELSERLRQVTAERDDLQDRLNELVPTTQLQKKLENLQQSPASDKTCNGVVEQVKETRDDLLLDLIKSAERVKKLLEKK